MKRKRIKTEDKIRYIPAGFIIILFGIFYGILFNMFYWAIITEKFSAFSIFVCAIAFLFITLLFIVTILERTDALKKLAEWKAQGFDVRQYDQSRRRWYPI
jgi:Trk-type K+ transport system membrane component